MEDDLGKVGVFVAAVVPAQVIALVLGLFFLDPMHCGSPVCAQWRVMLKVAVVCGVAAAACVGLTVLPGRVPVRWSMGAATALLAVAAVLLLARLAPFAVGEVLLLGFPAFKLLTYDG